MKSILWGLPALLLLGCGPDPTEAIAFNDAAVDWTEQLTASLERFHTALREFASDPKQTPAVLEAPISELRDSFQEIRSGIAALSPPPSDPGVQMQLVLDDWLASRDRHILALEAIAIDLKSGKLKRSGLNSRIEALEQKAGWNGKAERTALLQAQRGFAEHHGFPLR